MNNNFEEISGSLESINKLTEVFKEWFTEEQLREMEEKYNKVKKELEKKKNPHC